MDNNNDQYLHITIWQSIKTMNQIKPFRKYQCILILLIIILITVVTNLLSLNSILKFKLVTQINLDKQLYTLDKEIDFIIQTSAKLKFNYQTIYKLEDKPYTNIIQTPNELSMLHSWIGDKYAISYKLCYKATLHGDYGEDLRRECSGQSPNILLIETVDGFRFGAYTSKPWMGNNQYVYDEEAFIFSFNNNKKYPVLRPERAIFDCSLKFPEYGGTGSTDIHLEENFFVRTNGNIADFPIDYTKDPEAFGEFPLTGGIRRFKIKEVEMLIVFLKDS